MKYTKNEIGYELIKQLETGCDIEKIANWAYELHISSPKETSHDIDNILQSIYMMDAGPEFEFTKQELGLLSKLLINGDENPLEKIKAIRQEPTLLSKMNDKLNSDKKELFEKINVILLKDWDPIGIQHVPSAQDEYVSYIPIIYDLLISEKNEFEIFECLWWIETDRMGLSGNRSHTEAISKKLRALL